ncbi:MAG TPA: DUF952 domain-containing protein [Rhizomicrobium sp.]|nr:DUF952 domain-containing protein [Rhizomicrobium sp.]
MLIFKIVHAEEWRAAEAAGIFSGSAKDKEDGFLHFSSEEQLDGTVAKYYAGQRGLVLVAVDPETLGGALKYEPSRGGELFPHLYGTLPLDAVLWTRPFQP